LILITAAISDIAHLVRPKKETADSVTTLRMSFISDSVKQALDVGYCPSKTAIRNRQSAPNKNPL
jgi:hypothetical protein